MSVGQMVIGQKSWTPQKRAIQKFVKQSFQVFDGKPKLQLLVYFQCSQTCKATGIRKATCEHRTIIIWEGLHFNNIISGLHYLHITIVI
jgi:hypothetical protein